MNLQEIISAFSKQTLLIVGDVMLDEYVWGDVHRISPEAPVPVLKVARRSMAPGGAANVAANAAVLGARVVLGGVVGADLAGEMLRGILQEKYGGADGLIIDPLRSTTVKTRIVAHHHHIVRVDVESHDELSTYVESSFLEWVEHQLPSITALVLSDYAKGFLSLGLTQRLITLARTRGYPIIVDPKTNDLSKYLGATVITPNQREAEDAAGIPIRDEASLTLVGNKLLAKLAETALLITRGADGMSLFVNGQAPSHVRTEAREVFDVTGAGDTGLAIMTLAVASGATLEEAMRIANKAAGIVVGKVGTATVSIKELMDE